jgi:transcriptional regulator with XRE-family HTH domain
MKKQMAGVDSQEERTIFGQTLRRLRIQQRLRQRDLHLLTGIAPSHICEIEAGTCNIAIDTMVKLARVMKLPLWQMFKPGDGENAQPMADGRSAPRSRKWHEDNLSQKVFDFSDAEMRDLRKSAAAAGLSVTDFLRQILSEAGVLTPVPRMRCAD